MTSSKKKCSRAKVITGRRDLLSAWVAGSALALSGGARVAAAAAAPIAPDQPDPLAAWNSLPSVIDFPDVCERAAAFGLLAPNVQDFQPWIIKREGDNALLVHADLSRRVPFSDLPDRQLTVSFGTFVELMAIGMSTQGYRLDVHTFPEGTPSDTLDRRPVLRIRLFEDATVRPDPLAAAILARSTNRLPFDTSRPVPANLLDAVRVGANDPEVAGVEGDPAKAARIRSIAREAYILEVSIEVMLRELANVTRIGPADIAAYRWGPIVSGPDATARSTISIRRDLHDVTSDAYAAAVTAYLAAVDSGRSYVWVATPDNSRESMIRGGRAWARLHLTATALGLKMQPHSQSLHDYPEIEASKRAMHNEIGIRGTGRLQMLGRIGYAPMAPHSPREAAGDHFSR